MAVQVLRRRFTVKEYYRMVQAGILKEDDRVELIEGEIIEMAPIGRRHATCIRRVILIFSELVRGRAIVDVQNPIHLGEYSEPQPDVVLLRLRPDLYLAGHPQPEDILLLIEVADTSVNYDRSVKGPLYAEAGIPEYWIVNPEDETVTVLKLDGEKYVEHGVFRRGEAASSVLLKGFTVSVDAVFDAR